MKLAEAKQIHDTLLANMPEGEAHASCGLCDVVTNETAAEISAPAIREEDNSMDPIYNQEQADALVAAAVAKAEQAAADAHTEALAAKEQEIEAVKAELAELQEKRDQDQVELAAAQSQVTELRDEIARRDEEVAREARKSERLAAVTELKAFTEAYVAENTDRFVGMSDEQFASYIEDVKALRAGMAPVEVASETTVPEETAMANESVETPKPAAVKTFFSDTLKGGIQ